MAVITTTASSATVLHVSTFDLTIFSLASFRFILQDCFPCSVATPVHSSCHLCDERLLR